MTLLDMYQTLTNNVCESKGVDPNNVFAVTALALEMNEDRCSDEELRKIKSELYKVTQRKLGQSIEIPSFLKDYMNKRNKAK